MKLNSSFILIRPYSLITILSIVLLGNVLSRGLVIDICFFIDVVFGLFLWITGMVFTEYWHRKTDERIKISKHWLYIAFSALIIFSGIRNVWTVFIVLFLFGCNVLYGLKTKPVKLSLLSFVFRGFLETLLLVIILFFHGIYDFLIYFNIILSVFLFTSARNIIGDIRDIEIDRYTFTKKYGEKISYALSVFLNLIGIVLINNFLVVFPIILAVVLILISPRKEHSYVFHRLLVLSMCFFVINYIADILKYSLLITNLGFLGAVLNITYDFVPRKSNRFFQKVW
ncbi:MAG: hypothetical protein DRP18_04030 [Candidatus Aenigmatarchaeota archaeon]|nr:MAG: hypothetical protein DRP18_04030 [Candidatus Aenigmarchaeota archaeon]